MKPRAWSHSALETHHNCPEQYRHKYVLKDLPPEVKTVEQEWGTHVHKQFEDYLMLPGFKLPVDLRIHQPYLDRLKAIAHDAGEGGRLWAERKVALSRKPLAPCEYFAHDVWWRGIIDVTVLEPEQGRARIADFKTGKPHTKWDQLAISAIWAFLKYPEINLVQAEFYWTKDQTVTKKVWARSEIDALFAMLVPKLTAYALSFKNDVWPKKQSGLCGWCPCTMCEFWFDRTLERRRR